MNTIGRKGFGAVLGTTFDDLEKLAKESFQRELEAGNKTDIVDFYPTDKYPQDLVTYSKPVVSQPEPKQQDPVIPVIQPPAPQEPEPVYYITNPVTPNISENPIPVLTDLLTQKQSVSTNDVLDVKPAEQDVINTITTSGDPLPEPKTVSPSFKLPWWVWPVGLIVAYKVLKSDDDKPQSKPNLSGAKPKTKKPKVAKKSIKKLAI